ncbi:hypothetical protein HDU83_007603 [Entophlyctis luteolus]|nr:hypothetical protein HDU83_007603 [Entophlyctis luteolus]
MFASVRSYATKIASTPGTRRKPVAGITDKRIQVVRDILYPAPTKTQTPPALEVSGESLTQRELIERMWCRVKVKPIEKKAKKSFIRHPQQTEAIEIEERLQRKYLRMRAAMEDLEANHKELFKGTGQVFTSAIDKGAIFPRRMRVPTETPPSAGWEYERKQ